MEPIKIQFGAGGNNLVGWINHDIDVDITKSLPYKNEIINAIFCEHVVEHLSSGEAYKFFEECFRILLWPGYIRVAVPSIENIAINMTDNYKKFVSQWGKPIQAICCNHGHKTMWNDNILKIILEEIGFSAYKTKPNKSQFDIFKNIDGHAKEIGIENNLIETIVVEGIKCDFKG